MATQKRPKWLYCEQCATLVVNPSRVKEHCSTAAHRHEDDWGYFQYSGCIRQITSLQYRCWKCTATHFAHHSALEPHARNFHSTTKTQQAMAELFYIEVGGTNSSGEAVVEKVATYNVLTQKPYPPQQQSTALTFRRSSLPPEKATPLARKAPRVQPQSATTKRYQSHTGSTTDQDEAEVSENATRPVRSRPSNNLRQSSNDEESENVSEEHQAAHDDDDEEDSVSEEHEAADDEEDDAELQEHYVDDDAHDSTMERPCNIDADRQPLGEFSEECYKEKPAKYRNNNDSQNDSDEDEEIQAGDSEEESKERGHKRKRSTKDKQANRHTKQAQAKASDVTPAKKLRLDSIIHHPQDTSKETRRPSEATVTTTTTMTAIPRAKTAKKPNQDIEAESSKTTKRKVNTPKKVPHESRSEMENPSQSSRAVQQQQLSGATDPLERARKLMASHPAVKDCIQLLLDSFNQPDPLRTQPNSVVASTSQTVEDLASPVSQTMDHMDIVPAVGTQSLPSSPQLPTNTPMQRTGELDTQSSQMPQLSSSTSSPCPFPPSQASTVPLPASTVTNLSTASTTLAPPALQPQEQAKETLPKIANAAPTSTPPDPSAVSASPLIFTPFEIGDVLFPTQQLQGNYAIP